MLLLWLDELREMELRFFQELLIALSTGEQVRDKTLAEWDGLVAREDAEPEENQLQLKDQLLEDARFILLLLVKLIDDDADEMVLLPMFD